MAYRKRAFSPTLRSSGRGMHTCKDKHMPLCSACCGCGFEAGATSSHRQSRSPSPPRRFGRCHSRALRRRGEEAPEELEQGAPVAAAPAVTRLRSSRSARGVWRSLPRPRLQGLYLLQVPHPRIAVARSIHHAGDASALGAGRSGGPLVPPEDASSRGGVAAVGAVVVVAPEALSQMGGIRGPQASGPLAPRNLRHARCGVVAKAASGRRLRSRVGGQNCHRVRAWWISSAGGSILGSSMRAWEGGAASGRPAMRGDGA